MTSTESYVAFIDLTINWEFVKLDPNKEDNHSPQFVFYSKGLDVVAQVT